jgi:hypothetical protein
VTVRTLGLSLIIAGTAVGIAAYVFGRTSFTYPIVVGIDGHFADAWFVCEYVGASLLIVGIAVFFFRRPK